MSRLIIRSLFFVLGFCPGLALAQVLELTAEQSAHLELTTARVESREEHPVFDLTGTLVPDRRKVFHIAPVVDGTVVSLGTVEHDHVRQGQVLARLHSNTLGQAQAEYLGALARFQLAQAERERIQTLWQDGVVPESRWLAVDSDYLSARASLDQAQRLLSLAGLSEDRIRALEQNLDPVADFTLVSPIEGMVVDARIEVGQMLSAGESAFRVVDLSILWVEVRVPVALLPQVRPGAEARVQVRAYPGRSFSGLLQSLGGEVDEDSQTLGGRVVIENQAGLLRPGMYGQVALVGTPRQGLVVPATAVFSMGDQPYVFKVAGPRRFELLAVEVGPAVDTWIPVKEGALAAGTEIVEGGLAELKSHWLYQGGE